MRQAILWIVLVIPGIVGAAVFTVYAVIDYAALQAAFTALVRAAQHGADLPTLFLAESAQNIHRINLFAEGVWALLSAIYAAIGIHGLCVLRKERDAG